MAEHPDHETVQIPPQEAPQATEGQDSLPSKVGALTVLTNVFFSPREAFTSLKGTRWMWVLPMVLFVLTTALAQFAYWYRVDYGEFMWQQVKHNRLVRMGYEANPSAFEQQIEAAKEKSPAFSASIRSIPAIITIPVWLFLAAFVYWLSFMAMGAELKYGAALNAVSWCSMPLVLKNLLMIPVVFMKDPTFMDPNNVVFSNLAAIIGLETLPGWLYVLLTFADAFLIWKIVLYLTAFSILGKTTKGRAAVVVLGLLSLWIIVGTVAGGFMLSN